jgi:histone H3/H4
MGVRDVEGMGLLTDESRTGLLIKELAKVGLQKHHGIPVGEDQAGALDKIFNDLDDADERFRLAKLAFDRLLQSDAPDNAVRLAGVAIHALENKVERNAARLILDAAECSGSEAVREFLIQCGDRLGGLGREALMKAESMADDLVDEVDGGADAEEAERLVRDLGVACTLGVEEIERHVNRILGDRRRLFNFN